MDSRQLQYFVVLADTLNFRRAAELLHISQPPLSVAIRKLEASFGVALFERSTRRVSLTAAGEAALVDVRKVLFHLEQARRHALQTVEGVRGQLIIGSVASATLWLIPKIVPPFRQQYPAVELVLRELPSNRIVEEVQNGVMDIGLVRSPIIGPYNVSTIILQKDRLIAVVSAQSRFAECASIDLSVLAAEPFVSYSHDESTGLNFAVANACQAAGFLPRVVHETTQIQTAISLVASGLGVALVPSLHARAHIDNVRFLTLKARPDTPDIGLALVYNAEIETTIARHFRESTLRVTALSRDQ